MAETAKNGAIPAGSGGGHMRTGGQPSGGSEAAATVNRGAAADNRATAKMIVEAMRQMGDMVADTRIAILDNRRAADINRETAKMLQDLADGING